MEWNDLEACLVPPLEADGKSPEQLCDEARRSKEGRGCPRCLTQARRLWEEAARRGAPEAAEALSRLAELKERTIQDDALFREGIRAGQEGRDDEAFASALDNVLFFEDPLMRGLGAMADLFRDGRGVAQDVEKACAIYRFEAEELGKGHGWSALGKLREAPEGSYPGIHHSADAALALYLRSFEDSMKDPDFKGPRYAGDLLAAGYVHEDGEIEEPDWQGAAALYRRAADGLGGRFDHTACMRLGRICEEGRPGIRKDAVRAFAWYGKAVTGPEVHSSMLGIPYAWLALGRLLSQGRGTERNLDEARACLGKAEAAAAEVLSLQKASGREEARMVQDEAGTLLQQLAHPSV
jgi:TPR repeat protein